MLFQNKKREEKNSLTASCAGVEIKRASFTEEIIKIHTTEKAVNQALEFGKRTH